MLFIKLAEQGSTVLAYPALARAVAECGPANVHFLVFAENRFILDAMRVLPAENILALRTDSLAHCLGDALQAVRRLRRLRLAEAVDLEFFSRASACLAYLSGAWVRVGLHAFHGEGPWRGDLLTHRLSFNPHLHTADLFLCLTAAAACDPRSLPALPLPVPPPTDQPRPRFEPDPACRDEVLRLLAAHDTRPGTQPVFLLNPNCGDMLPLRRWPGERYAALAARLLAEWPQARIVFTGLTSEAARTEAIVERIADPRCFSLAGQTGFAQLLTLYGLADVLVTNDSGPAHFATLTDIEVVVLFGPETPALFGARTPTTHALTAGLPCSPCVNAANNRRSACRNNLCMQRLGVETVLDAVRQACAARRARPIP